LNVRDACQARSIARLGTQTPLLVPSFSSRGFPDIAAIHALTSEYLFDVSLVSAYDLHYGSLHEAAIYATDLLFLDSGGYEARVAVDPLEPYADARGGQAWTSDDYDCVLRQLQPLAEVVIVNFDFTDPRPISEQIEQALALFDAHPDFAGDFLCKPTATGTWFVDVQELIHHVDVVAQFDLIGLTEKELGPSLLERCQILLRLRCALSARGHGTPIHVFGSLDPATVLAYFLCGADVFDGLAWLRFAYREATPIYHAAAIVADSAWSVHDEDLVMLHRVQNLDWLKEQQCMMRAFCGGHVLADLDAMCGLMQQVVPLVRAAGLVVEE
jgi:hypothetical protein